MVYTPKHNYRSRAVAINLSRINLLFLILIAILSVIYLFQISFAISRGWQRYILGQQIKEGRKQARELELQTIELQSMQKIDEQSRKLGLVPTNRARYIRTREAVVALK